jgi:putative IMPACT (imprinted ancient) family translation regulator
VGEDLTNLLLVVTRYYGGTKLGTGGLTHAYSEAAQAVLAASGRQEHFVQTAFDVVIEFTLYDRVQRIIAKLGAIIAGSEFSDQVKLRISIRKSRAEELRGQLIEISNGRASIEENH